METLWGRAAARKAEEECDGEATPAARLRGHIRDHRDSANSDQKTRGKRGRPVRLKPHRGCAGKQGSRPLPVPPLQTGSDTWTDPGSRLLALGGRSPPDVTSKAAFCPPSPGNRAPSSQKPVGRQPGRGLGPMAAVVKDRLAASVGVDMTGTDMHTFSKRQAAGLSASTSRT